jgi:hypothetical protein
MTSGRPECDQFRCVSANAVDVASAPAVIEPYVAAFDPPQFAQALQECRDTGPPVRVVGGLGHKNANAPNLIRLLRPHPERPSCRRTAKQRDELAPLHSITSSAVASNVGGISRPSA